MEIERTIETIKSSIALICECRREKDVQNVLGSQLDCKIRYTLSSDNYPNVEIDLLGDNFAIEIKLNDAYYSGISQVLIQKCLYNVQNVILLHINSYLDSKFSNAIKELATKLGFMGILIHQRRKTMEVVGQFDG